MKRLTTILATVMALCLTLTINADAAQGYARSVNTVSKTELIWNMADVTQAEMQAIYDKLPDFVNGGEYYTEDGVLTKMADGVRLFTISRGPCDNDVTLICFYFSFIYGMTDAQNMFVNWVRNNYGRTAALTINNAYYTGEYPDDLLTCDDATYQKAIVKARELTGTSTSSSTTSSSTSTSTSTTTTAKHTHSYEKEQTNATCTEDGKIVYTCSCGESYEEIIPALGHEYESTTVDPTCEERGYTTYVCQRCGDTYTETIDAIGHDYEVTETKEPTCTEDGYITYTCKNCGATYQEVIEKLGHTKGEATTTESTLFGEGTTEYYCTVCGELIESESIESVYEANKLYFILGGAGGVVVIAGVTILVAKLIKRKRIKR